jgi:palmitoyltransferase ZDHHC1/11
MALCECPSKQR